MLALLCTIAVGTSLKLLLIHAYHSTDFEVHRTWMALTSTKPIEQWYTDETSQWTLDYPPLFAWFERALALGAPLFDAKMLVLSASPYASRGTVVYQRGTVMVTDVILLIGSYALTKASDTSKLNRLTCTALTFLNAGLLLVDHIHFQYNGMLIGLLLLSVALVCSGHDRLGALAFAILLNLKHLFLFLAPLYFVYLLRRHVMEMQSPSMAAFRRLATLGGIVCAVFAVSLGPFLRLGQLPQLASRLFPFGRGLTHAYWAPNIWALYTLLDRVCSAVVRRLAPALINHSTGATSGIVGEVKMGLLPSITAGHTAALVLIAQAPVLWGTWCAPKRAAFAPAVAYCGLTAFLLGYHVHEKAVLPPLVVIGCLIPRNGSNAASVHARLLIVLASAGYYAQLPLLYQPAEWAIARLLPLAHLCATSFALKVRLGVQKLDLCAWERGYMLGFGPIEAFNSFVHPTLVAPRLPFLPLLATSTYCAVGAIYSGWLMFKLWCEYHDESASKALDSGP